MKLLFITQKIDLNDDVLGVYHNWANDLAKKFDKVSIICLFQGKTKLSNNVDVFSLGKESGCSRLKYIFKFYKYIWQLRKNYDTVLVHMNPIYIILGGFFWKLYSKKISLWYNHPMGNFTVKMGIFLADKVFCTSNYAFAFKYKKTKIMPVGIDLSVFKKDLGVIRKNDQILCLGRISPIKKIEYLVDAVKILDSRGVNFRLLMVGSPVTEKDKLYESKLKNEAADLVLKKKVVFLHGISNNKTPAIYSNSGLFINLTPTGSFDKTTLEAMACQTPVLVSNEVFKKFFSLETQVVCMFKENSATDLADKIELIFALPIYKKQELAEYLRKIVTNNHSLDTLVNCLHKDLVNMS